MKKSLSVFVGLLVALGAVSADAATNWGTRAGSSADLSSAPLQLPLQHDALPQHLQSQQATHLLHQR